MHRTFRPRCTTDRHRKGCPWLYFHSCPCLRCSYPQCNSRCRRSRAKCLPGSRSMRRTSRPRCTTARHRKGCPWLRCRSCPCPRYNCPPCSSRCHHSRAKCPPDSRSMHRTSRPRCTTAHHRTGCPWLRCRSCPCPRCSCPPYNSRCRRSQAKCPPGSRSTHHTSRPRCTTDRHRKGCPWLRCRSCPFLRCSYPPCSSRCRRSRAKCLPDRNRLHTFQHHCTTTRRHNPHFRYTLPSRTRFHWSSLTSCRHYPCASHASNKCPHLVVRTAS